MYLCRIKLIRIMKNTKIVASIADYNCEPEFLKALWQEGMNVVRINTAHGTQESFSHILRNVRQVSNEIATLIDTKGPEVRTTATSDGKDIVYKTGEIIRIVAEPETLTTHDVISVTYPLFVQDMQVGAQVLIDDGEVGLFVREKSSNSLTCMVQNDATLGSRKSVNVPGVRINLPSLTERDRQNILYAIDNGIDFIAHSFVRNKQDVLCIREILDQHHSDIQIIAKIENQEGVDNIEEILDVADGVMVARGDLGIEVAQECIPGIQRMLVKTCLRRQKPVIVATQMLQNMINNPRPTRAELTDIANAIYLGTDAIMLSGETAKGKYPVEAVQTMATVAAQAEKDMLYDFRGHSDSLIPVHDVREFLSEGAVLASSVLPLKLILTDCQTGKTAKILTSYRSNKPIYAICHSEQTARHLALSYGVHPLLIPQLGNSHLHYVAALKLLLERGIVHESDMIAYLSGGHSEKTSSLEINTVSEVK